MYISPGGNGQNLYSKPLVQPQRINPQNIAAATGTDMSQQVVKFAFSSTVSDIHGMQKYAEQEKRKRQNKALEQAQGINPDHIQPKSQTGLS